MEILTKSARETQKLGEKLATDLGPGSLSPSGGATIICLSGELGSGKTTFIQGMARGWGIKKRILSPTFVMIRAYAISNQQLTINNFYHTDLYRVESERDVKGLGLLEIWSDPTNVVAIEWAEKIKEILPTKRIEVHFDYVSDQERKVNISYINI